MPYLMKLTRGYSTIVDSDLPENLKWILHQKWYAHKSRCSVYARSSKYGFLHRVLKNTPKHLQVDHINGDQLDNRLENLRNCTASTNIKSMIEAKNKENPLWRSGGRKRK